MSERIDLAEIRDAHERIRPHVLRSPLVSLSGCDVSVKAESLQATGAFKIRGALNTMLLLGGPAISRGVVAHSSGNHAIAVACAAQRLGVDATVVMPGDAPRVKVDGARSFGADVVLVGPSSGERLERAHAIADSRGLPIVEPYDSRSVIAATATIGVEILEQSPDVEEIYVAVSGGGLAAGVALAVALLAPQVRVIGVEPEVAADALASRRVGHPVALPAEDMARTCADGLRVQRVGDVPWPYIRDHLSDIVTVTEDEILAAMGEIVRRGRLVAEPSGAVAVAAAYRQSGRPAVAVLSGGNVDPDTLRGVLDMSAPDSGGSTTAS